MDCPEVLEMSEEQRQERVISRLRARLARERRRANRVEDEIEWFRQKVHEVGGLGALERRQEQRRVRGILYREI